MNAPIVSINNLQDFYFSGNIPRIRVLAIEPIEVTIQLVSNNGFTITELHEPRLNEDIVLDINSLIHKHLTAVWVDQSPPGQSTYDLMKSLIQLNNFGEVTITPNGQTPVSFKVIKGVVDAPNTFDFLAYCQGNLLNLCPQVLKVGYNDPFALNYYALSAFVIKLSANVFTGSDPNGNPQYSTINGNYISINHSNALITIKADFKLLSESLSLYPSHEIMYIDIWAENNSTSLAKTAPLRLFADKYKHQYIDVFAFENSLGGIEIIRFTGVLSKNIEHNYLSHSNQNYTLEYETLNNTIYEKNTGFLVTPQQAVFADDFLASNMRYHYSGGVFKRIHLTGKTATYQKGKLSYYSFSFAYAREKGGTLLNRKTSL